MLKQGALGLHTLFVFYLVSCLGCSPFNPLLCSMYGFALYKSRILMSFHLLILCFAVFFLSSIESFNFLFFQTLIVTFLFSYLIPRVAYKKILTQLMMIFGLSLAYHAVGLLCLLCYEPSVLNASQLLILLKTPFKDLFFTLIFFYIPFLFYTLLGKLRLYVTFRKRYRRSFS